MLVLSRKRDERIRIGNNIEIIVVEIQGGRVRLGITAPSNIPVHRAEIAEQIKNAQSTSAPVDDQQKEHEGDDESDLESSPHQQQAHESGNRRPQRLYRTANSAYALG